MSFSRRDLLLASLAAPLTGCSPFEILNGWTRSSTYDSVTGLAYGSHARQVLDVYKPLGTAGPAPVVVFFYGGNWKSGNRSDYLFAGAALASRGFVAVVPDYRLYPEVRFPEFLHDCALAVRWTHEQAALHGGDPGRVFLMGHSAGAYNAAMLALNGAYLRAAGAEPARIGGLIGLAGPYDFLPLTGETTKAVFGFPDTPPETQPIQFATAAAPPALLITVKQDDTVDPANSARLAARLRDQGVLVRELTYTGLGHATLIGALAPPLSAVRPLLDDVALFVGQAGRTA